MNPYYSFNKKESVLLLISFLVLILLMLAAGWVLGTVVSPKSAEEGTAAGKQGGRVPGAGKIPGVAQAKKLLTPLTSAKRSASRLVPKSKSDGAGPSSATDAEEEEQSADEGQETERHEKQSENAPPQDLQQDRDRHSDTQADIQAAAQEKDKTAQPPPGEEQEKDKAGSANARFCVIADTFVVKTKALKRVNELKEKGYAQASILCFPPYDRDSNMMNYLIQIGSYESHAEADLAASQFQEKEKSLAVVRSISLSDLKEKAMKPESGEG